MIWYKYEASYIDENGVQQYRDVESGAKFTDARRSFTYECLAKGWEFVYFNQISTRRIN